MNDALDIFWTLTPFWQVVATLALLLVPSIAVGLGLRKLLLLAFEEWLRLRKAPVGAERLQGAFAVPLTLVVYSSLMLICLPIFEVSRRKHAVIEQWAQVVLTISVAWLVFRLILFLESVFERLFDISGENNLRARRMRTQLQFVMKLALILVSVVGFAAVLMNFQGARRIGTSLIASAGVASIVIGFAAQKSLANLIAGFQIAFTQPVRIDDVVIVEKQWGRVEEIALTYVVVRLWDLRRLVVPITYFVENPFENWTRNSSDLLGTVFVHADYRLPLDRVREELPRIAASSPLWDKKVCLLQVTDADARTIQLRALLSARNASDLFDLRCYVREKLVDFIQREFPDHLPQTRGGTSPVLPA